MVRLRLMMAIEVVFIALLVLLAFAVCFVLATARRANPRSSAPSPTEPAASPFPPVNHPSRSFAPSSTVRVPTLRHAYEPQTNLLTPAERSFFGVLEQVTARDYRLFAKVRLADVVRPARCSSRSERQSALNRIVGKHLDFVLCEPASFRIIAVIELDDKSHKRFERGFRDSLVDAALAEAGIPILRVAASHAYSINRLREEVARALQPQGAPARSEAEVASGYSFLTTPSTSSP